jgi:hypothetical protein
MENWQDIPGYEGIYQISDLGRVKSIRTGKILVIDHGKYGHGQVCLSVDGQRQKASVHRAVLEAFSGAPEAGQVARHLNGDARDNRLQNLVWGTPKENTSDMLRHGTVSHGEKHPISRLTNDQARAIRCSKERGRALAKTYGIDPALVSMIRTGKVWKHV